MLEYAINNEMEASGNLPPFLINNSIFRGDKAIPLSKGGSHTKKNCQCLCRQCNSTKHNSGKGDQLRLFG